MTHKSSDRPSGGLAARSAGIPLPLPRLTRDGRVVLPAEDAVSAWSVRVYQWADIAGGQAVTGAEVGAVTARLHQVPHAAWGPVEAWFSEPVGEPAWHALLAGARRRDAGWAPMLARRLPGLIALDAAVTRAGYAAYRAAGGTARLSRISDFATAAAVPGHLLQFYGRRALDPAENATRARRRLDHMLRQPLSLSRIDRLLHLLRP